MSKLLSFEKLRNTRDLCGMKTADGLTIKSGLLFRSGHLSEISDSDINKISGIIHTIIDFRTDKERKEQPDREIPGTSNIHIPIMDSLTAGISREKKADQAMFKKLMMEPVKAKDYMCNTYRGFVSDYAVSQYSSFLRIVMNASDGVLWHCTAGKDRAGIASVLVEEILGIPRDEIVMDYLKTNEYLEQDLLFLTDYVKKKSGIENELADEALRYLLGAEKDYIESFYQAVDDKYGNIDRFIRDGLKISEIEQKKLRAKYLDD